MADTFRLDDFRPAVTINNRYSNTVRVVPLSVFTQVAEGTMKFSDIDDSDDIAQVMVQELLKVWDAEAY